MQEDQRSAYWKDKGDPLGLVHGYDKWADASQRLVAMTILAWQFKATFEQKRAADSVLRAQFPNLDEMLARALEEVCALDRTVERRIQDLNRLAERSGQVDECLPTTSSVMDLTKAMLR